MARCAGALLAGVMQGQNSGQLEESIGSLDLSFQQPHKYQLLEMVFLIKKRSRAVKVFSSQDVT